jgi:COP9 signalosome complex subunit 6
VIASTCDHYTRVSTGGSKLPTSAPVFGLLFGVRTSEAGVSICDSVDINYTYTEDSVSILPGEVDSKSKLWTAVFTTYKLIGWYSFGNEINAMHNQVHEHISGFTQDPIFMLINQEIVEESGVLPLKVYKINSQTPSQNQFVEVEFVIETTDIEKISLDHITKSTPVPGLSSLEVQNQSTLTSLRILDNNVQTMVNVLRDMQSNKIPIDHTLLRQAAKICNSLPPIDSMSFQRDFEKDATNSLVLTYMNAISKTTGQMTEVTELYAGLYASSRGYGSSATI